MVMKMNIESYFLIGVIFVECCFYIQQLIVWEINSKQLIRSIIIPTIIVAATEFLVYYTTITPTFNDMVIATFLLAYFWMSWSILFLLKPGRQNITSRYKINEYQYKRLRLFNKRKVVNEWLKESRNK